MSNKITSIESQIKVLETKYDNYIVNPFTGKYDSGYYALKNKIINLKKQLFKLQNTKAHHDWLAQ